MTEFNYGLEGEQEKEENKNRYIKFWDKILSYLPEKYADALIMSEKINGIFVNNTANFWILSYRMLNANIVFTYVSPLVFIINWLFWVYWLNSPPTFYISSALFHLYVFIINIYDNRRLKKKHEEFRQILNEKFDSYPDKIIPKTED